MRHPITPSRWVWLALGLVFLTLLVYWPSRQAPSPDVADRPITTPTLEPAEARLPATIPSPGPAAPPLLTATDTELERIVRGTVGDDDDHYAVVVKELRQGTGVSINAERIYYAASLFKLAVMYEAFRQDGTGELDLGGELTVTPEAAAEDLGTLDFWPFGVGDRVTAGELVDLMVTASDNTASVVLRDALGRTAIDRSMQALGLRSTSVSSPDLPTSAADMTLLLEAIAIGRGVSAPASAAMIELLQQQWVRDRIPAGLPPHVPVGNKTGSWDNAAHDVAIVDAPSGPYLLVVLSDLPGDDATIVAISQQIYAYYAVHARSP
ncbi:MAG: serine hydrolase [Dehalococcoidia bacterium]